MQIQEQMQGAVNVLKPGGALIQDDAAMFRTRVLEATRDSLGRIVVDAAAVPYADSDGLSALMDAADEMRRVGRTLKLCGLTDTLREAIELTDLSTHFDIYEDSNTAVRSFV